jgi:hypothetical protein
MRIWNEVGGPGAGIWSICESATERSDEVLNHDCAKGVNTIISMDQERQWAEVCAFSGEREAGGLT